MTKYVRCPIHGYIKLNNIETKLIDTQLFQRLRNIHQQGTAFYTYPGATHSRFEHSLGVLHLSELVFNELYTKKPLYFDDDKSNSVQLTRLLGLFHDIGHGPFSHVSDPIQYQLMNQCQREEMGGLDKINSPHEYFAYIFLRDHLSKYLSKIEEIDGNLLEYLSENAYKIYSGETVKTKKKGAESPFKKYGLCIKNIIDGTIDVDKMDFLMRDSYLVGLSSGSIDINRLIRTSDINEETNKIYYSRQAISTVEDLIIKRYQQYKWINFHHAVCFTDEIMCRLIWLGVTNDIFNKDLFRIDHFNEICEYDIEYFGRRSKNPMSEILDDRLILTKLRAHTDAPLIKTYLDMLERRQIYKPIWKVSSSFEKEEMRVLKKLFDRLEIDIIDKNIYEDSHKKIIEDKIKTTLKMDDAILTYKPYKPIKITGDNTIHINTIQGLKPIQDISYIIKSVISEDYFVTPPLYVPSYLFVPGKYEKKIPKIREKVIKIIDNEVGG